MVKRSQIERELKIIKRQGRGLVSPHAVVAFAKNPKTALHNEFTWDDGKAAQEYRLWQARRILNVYVAVIHENTPPVRVWASLPNDRKSGGGYRAMVDVLNNADRREQLLAMALRDLAIFRRKYASLKELARVFEAIDGLDGRVAATA